MAVSDEPGAIRTLRRDRTSGQTVTAEPGLGEVPDPPKPAGVPNARVRRRHLPCGSPVLAERPGETDEPQDSHRAPGRLQPADRRSGFPLMWSVRGQPGRDHHDVAHDHSFVAAHKLAEIAVVADAG